MDIDPQFDEMLAKVREPAIWLRRTQGATTKSKLGGLPSLPAGTDWPRHGKTGLPLHFLAQIDLSALPRTPLSGARHPDRLPDSGALFFFADIEEEMLWDFEPRNTVQDVTRVVFAPAFGASCEAPVDLPKIGHSYGEDGGGSAKEIRVFPEAPVEAFVIFTFAGVALYFQGDASKQADLRTMRSIARATGEPIPVFSMPEGHFPYLEAPAGFRERKGPGGTVVREAGYKRHQMLGAATNVQGTAEGARGQGLVPLLQLDTDWGLHRDFTFCDMGMAQFWIRDDDLKAGRFERAWATTEGG